MYTQRGEDDIGGEAYIYIGLHRQSATCEQRKKEGNALERRYASTDNVYIYAIREEHKVSLFAHRYSRIYSCVRI